MTWSLLWMLPFRKAVVGAVAALLLAGCDGSTTSTDAPMVLEFAKNVATLLRAGDIDSVEERVSPRVRSGDAYLRPKIQRFVGLFPKGAPDTFELVGSQKHTINGVTTYIFSFENGSEDRWAVLTTQIEMRGDQPFLFNLNVAQNRQSLRDMHALRFSDKTFSRYLFLIYAAGALALSIYALVKCIRMPRLKYKWLWCLFVVVGVGQLSVSWTTGAYSYAILWAGIPISSISWGEFTPVVINTTLPLGALIFLNRFGTPEPAELANTATSSDKEAQTPLS